MKELIIDCFAGGGLASVGIEMALGRPIPKSYSLERSGNHDGERSNIKN